MATNQENIPKFKNACQRLIGDVLELQDSRDGARNGVKDDHGIDMLDMTVGSPLVMPVLVDSLQGIVDQLIALGY
jgi:hypothetical protein